LKDDLALFFTVGLSNMAFIISLSLKMPTLLSDDGEF